MDDENTNTESGQDDTQGQDDTEMPIGPQTDEEQSPDSEGSEENSSEDSGPLESPPGVSHYEMNPRPG